MVSLLYMDRREESLLIKRRGRGQVHMMNLIGIVVFQLGLITVN